MTRAQAMRNYILTAAALFLGCGLAVLVGLDPVGAVLFPIPVAVCLVRRQPGRALGLIGCAAAAAVAATALATAVDTEASGAVDAAAIAEIALRFALIAALGVPLGLGLLRHWTYGWTVAATTAWAYFLVLSAPLLRWREWLTFWQQTYDLIIAQVQSEAAQANPEAAAMYVRNVTWLRDHWSSIGLGLTLWPLLMAACVAVSILAAWHRRRFQQDGIRGSFSTMRTSEWLVWAAIALAVLCYIAYTRPGSNLGVVSWNAAVGLAAVYWLNGVSTLAYVLEALRAPLLVWGLVVMVLVSSGSHLLLGVVGLFDTWGDFRRVIDRVVAARKQREQSKGNE